MVTETTGLLIDHFTDFYRLPLLIWRIHPYMPRHSSVIAGMFVAVVVPFAHVESPPMFCFRWFKLHIVTIKLYRRSSAGRRCLLEETKHHLHQVQGTDFFTLEDWGWPVYMYLYFMFLLICDIGNWRLGGGTFTHCNSKNDASASCIYHITHASYPCAVRGSEVTVELAVDKNLILCRLL